MSLSVEEIQKSDETCLVVTGEIDVSNASELRSAGTMVLESDQKLSIDLAQVSYIDSTGIGVLVGLARAAQGKVRVLHPQRNVARVFDMLGVTRELNVEG